MSLPQALKPAYIFDCPLPHCRERIRACQGQHVGDCGHEFDIWPLAGGGADVTFDRWQVAHEQVDGKGDV